MESMTHTPIKLLGVSTSFVCAPPHLDSVIANL